MTCAILVVETVVAGYGASLIQGNSDWRALVADLRRSPHPDVRTAALTLPTAEE